MRAAVNAGHSVALNAKSAATPLAAARTQTLVAITPDRKRSIRRPPASAIAHPKGTLAAGVRAGRPSLSRSPNSRTRRLRA